MQYSTTLTGKESIVITIGNFDGIHKGHQSLLHEVCALASRLESRPVLVTFQPHTLKVVRPEIDLRCLTTLEEKLALAESYGGIKDSLVIHFTPEVAAMSARDFMDQLRTDFHLTGLVVGNNFSLGHKRMGNIAFLQEYGEEHNIEVQTIDIQQAGAAQISSTRIRNLVSEGQVEEARALLGHPVGLRGLVIHGDQRGRLLGFPTANVIPAADKLIPANGVYAARIKIEEPATQSDIVHTFNVSNNATINDTGMRNNVTSPNQVTYTGAVNIGVRQTFDGQTRIVEAHLLDIDNIDLYDRSISIDFIARLRSEQRFAGIEALKTQIAEDVNNARHILQKDGQE